jgi:hypothetical protein
VAPNLAITGASVSEGKPDFFVDSVDLKNWCVVKAGRALPANMLCVIPNAFQGNLSASSLGSKFSRLKAGAPGR